MLPPYPCGGINTRHTGGMRDSTKMPTATTTTVDTIQPRIPPKVLGIANPFKKRG